MGPAQELLDLRKTARQLAVVQRVPGSCVGQLLLDLRGRRVTVARERQERRLLVREDAVVRARARRERLRIGEERVRAELTDARLDLVVPRGELLRRSERRRNGPKRLRDHV